VIAGHDASVLEGCSHGTSVVVELGPAGVVGLGAVHEGDTARDSTSGALDALWECE